MGEQPQGRERMRFPFLASYANWHSPSNATEHGWAQSPSYAVRGAEAAYPSSAAGEQHARNLSASFVVGHVRKAWLASDSAHAGHAMDATDASSRCWNPIR